MYQETISRSVQSSRSGADLEDQQQLQILMAKIADSRCKHSFAELFKAFAPKVKRMTMKHLGNDAQAMELTQDVMTQIWRKAHLYHPDKGAVSTWIYTIARNLCFDFLRKASTKAEFSLGDDLWPIADQVMAEHDVFSDHLSDQRLVSCVESLPEKQKQIVRGVFFQELSQEQLARQLNIPLGTVKSRLRLAIGKLKQELGVQYD
jgi:RNA polymerase sigma-70 factor (ECF subfamily)